ncbi:hypothetical protein [Phascolarctobacterium faecium]|jgi:hypothetical protein|uniref:hypothetical protein n=1 Tax=Phascolarctobacterium faecium TaxID=33025 RepID=UPI00266D552B|nr:hypothetical protein [Phascolarctobacterium faecium]
MSIDAEIEVTAINNATSGGMTVGYYGAEVAREYAEKAKDSARAAEEARNLSEAWAESTEAPTGEGTRSSKSWSEVSREWAEGEREPDGVEGARSSKAWNSVARAWAESDEEPDGTEGAKSAKTWANLAGEKAALATAMANEANVSRDSAKECANAARLFESSAENHATIAKQSADRATENLEAMKVNLSAKADVESPAFTGTPIVPTASGENAEQIANVAYVKESIATQIDALVGGSPDALDTLKELSDALGRDPNFSATMTKELSKKLDATANAVSATKAVQDGDGKVITETYATKDETRGAFEALPSVAKTGSYADLLNKPSIPAKTSDLRNDSRFVASDANGNVTITGTLTAAKVYNAYYNDYAEFFPRGGDTMAGDLIALDETATYERYVRATDKSKCVVGVESNEFAMIIGGEPAEQGENPLEKNLDRFIPVALMGRVHVRFSGKAEVGAFVIPSETPGVGRMALPGEDTSQSVGRILYADNAQNLRRIKILVGR